MKTRFILLFLLLPAALTPLAGEVSPTVPACFKTMPDTMIPASAIMRTDLLTYRENGLRSQVRGLFGNELEILEMTDTYLKLKTSERGTLQIKLLETDPERKDSSAFVLAVVRTVSAPARSSDLSFYSLEWTPVDACQAPAVDAKAFWDLPRLDSLSVSSKADAGDPWSSVEIVPAEILQAHLYAMTFHAAEPRLTVTSSAEALLGKRLFGMVSEAFHPEMTFRWNGIGFVRE